MPHPAERRLERVATDAEWLRGRLPKVLAALSATTPTGWPGGTEGGGTGVARPTEQAATAGLDQRRRYARIDSLAAEASGVVAELVREVNEVADPGVDTELEWSRHRCTGGEGEWADPTCERLAVRRITVESNQALELCWACIKRRQRWLQRLSA